MEMKKSIVLENRATFESRLAKRFLQEEVNTIMYAYDLAKTAHRHQNRDGGARYFEHPREMAIIAMDEFGIFDKDIICGLLLHDVGEDTSLFGNIMKGYDTFVQEANSRIEPFFGHRVSEIVIGMTKPYIDGVRFQNKEEMMRYYLSNMSKDVKTILCKMIDRLHNLRSLADLSDQKRIEKNILETKVVLIPVFENATHHALYGECVKSILNKINSQLNHLS